MTMRFPASVHVATCLLALAAAVPAIGAPPRPPAASSNDDAAGERALAMAQARAGELDACTRLILEGRPAEARPRLEGLLAARPDDARATFLLGMSHHRERNYAAAEPLMVRALELDPSDFVVHHFLGWARLHVGDLAGAGRSFERHWILQPGEPDTIFGLGLVAMEAGDAELAERRFTETIGLIRSFEQDDPARWRARRSDLGKCHARLGELAFAGGELDVARRQLEIALSIDPRQTTAWYTLSRVQRRLGDSEKAAIALRRFEEASGGELLPEGRAFRADDPERVAEPAAIPPRNDAPPAAPANPAAPARPDMPPIPAGAPPFAFTDVTAASGIGLITTNGRDPATVIAEVKGGGLALLDHDGDGDLDILIPNGATLESPGRGPGVRLYENQGGLQFRDATADAGLGEIRPWAMGVATGDVNDDGYVDVLLACLGPDRLLLGRPGGRFEDVTATSGIHSPGWSTAASFGDADGDGDLDLLVAGYIQLDPAAPPPPTVFRGMSVPAGPRGLAAAVDTLYENLGNGTFRDISVASGIRVVDAGYGLAAAIIDVDGDAQPELFIGNDSMPNRLFHRTADGRWVDQGLISGLATSGDGAPRATMGLAIGDLDDDGRPDVFTTNFAGEPNAAHIGTADGYHEDATSRLALAADSRGFLGWGCAIEDLDHDGTVEVLVVNGHVYPGATRETMLADERQVPLLMRRAAGGGGGGSIRYERVLPLIEGTIEGAADDPLAWLARPMRDRTLVLGDLDGDGDLDAVIGGLNQAVRVLRNDGSSGHWMIIRPGSRPEGCRIEVRRGSRTWRRWIVSGTGYCSAGPPSAHIGLGEGDGPVDVTVVWADGATVTRQGVRPDQHLTIDRPADG